MPTPSWWKLLVLIAGLVVAADGRLSGAEAQDAAGIEFFEKSIRPILVKRCYECHSAKAGCDPRDSPSDSVQREIDLFREMQPALTDVHGKVVREVLAECFVTDWN